MMFLSTSASKLLQLSAVELTKPQSCDTTERHALVGIHRFDGDLYDLRISFAISAVRRDRNNLHCYVGDFKDFKRGLEKAALLKALLYNTDNFSLKKKSVHARNFNEIHVWFKCGGTEYEAVLHETHSVLRFYYTKLRTRYHLGKALSFDSKYKCVNDFKPGIVDHRYYSPLRQHENH